MNLEAQPVLTDGTLTLRPWRADDADAVHRACQDPDIQRWTQVPVPYTRSDAEGFVTELAPAVWRDGTGVIFAVVDRSDALLASIGVVDLDRPNRSCEIGYWVAPDARRRGVASGTSGLPPGGGDGARVPR
jgi:RimJ/RimL family protein N-acetyltransferase